MHIVLNSFLAPWVSDMESKTLPVIIGSLRRGTGAPYLCSILYKAIRYLVSLNTNSIMSLPGRLGRGVCQVSATLLHPSLGPVDYVTMGL